MGGRGGAESNGALHTVGRWMCCNGRCAGYAGQNGTRGSVERALRDPAGVGTKAQGRAAGSPYGNCTVSLPDMPSGFVFSLTNIPSMTSFWVLPGGAGSGLPEASCARRCSCPRARASSTVMTCSRAPRRALGNSPRVAAGAGSVSGGSCGTWGSGRVGSLRVKREETRCEGGFGAAGRCSCSPV